MFAYFIRKMPFRFTLAIIVGVINGVSAVGVIEVISQGAVQRNHLPSLVWTFFGLCFVQIASRISSEILLISLTQDMILDFRVKSSVNLLESEYKKLESIGKPGLTAMLTSDIDMLTQSAHLVPNVIGNGIVIVFSLCYAAFLSLSGCLILLCFLAAGACIYHILERLPRAQMEQVREQTDVLYGNIRAILEGLKELQLSSRRKTYFLDNVFIPSVQRFRSLYSKAMIGYSFAVNIGGMLFIIAIGFLFFLFPFWLKIGPAVSISLSFLLLYLIQPVSNLVGSLPDLRRAEIAMLRLRHLNVDLAAHREQSVDEPSGDIFLPKAGGAEALICFVDVCHQYPSQSDDKTFMLGPLNLSIREGEVVFVVGGNGSGKTTLAMLILGFYEPHSGHIELNGQIVSNSRRVHYRNLFSAVFADFYLFDEVLSGEHDSNMVLAQEYLNKFDLTHKVEIKKNRFSTTKLSTGQRKRMALVSSYLEDRPIYLFDEWAADQDPVFKKVFYTELLPELKKRGKTIIVISHDDQYFNCADRVIKLQDGVIKPLLDSKVS
ncbi:cyclic peptide export ABC transporter [Granulicella mallensis]|uniref:Putative ATP-binding cassette transporter n=1 Tax=Granulicella mallensis TaxID=940614 RepID=A0A7W7ZTT3_9BACT|nr:cyclic peptide export ABC transporter [Granulicella mallensis]MBB5066039.1 putative ATP-binding cassette transporter [Granulicella mallensis]